MKHEAVRVHAALPPVLERGNLFLAFVALSFCTVAWAREQALALARERAVAH